jgi:hypothetical protein
LQADRLVAFGRELAGKIGKRNLKNILKI